MAIISCPECGHQVSDRAASCPSCGTPLAAAATSARVIEQTGKGLKAQQLLSILLLLVGVVFAIAASSGGGSSSGGIGLGGIMIVIGFLWYAVVRFRIWWHHR